MTAGRPWSKSDFSIRFWSHAAIVGAGENDCWEWTGKINPDGYGKTQREGHELLAHRVAYELRSGKIPAGMVLDHLCRNRKCVNPSHLEVVTLAENVLRGDSLFAQKKRQTLCIRGHSLSGRNLRIRKNGTRFCRECDRQRQHNYRKARQS